QHWLAQRVPRRFHRGQYSHTPGQSEKTGPHVLNFRDRAELARCVFTAETRRRGGAEESAEKHFPDRAPLSRRPGRSRSQSEDVFSAVNRIPRTSTPLLPTLESFPKMADMSQSDVSIPSQRCPGLAPGGGDAWTALQLQGVRAGRGADEPGRPLPDAGPYRIPLGGHGGWSVPLRRPAVPCLYEGAGPALGADWGAPPDGGWGDLGRHRRGAGAAPGGY